MLLDAHAHLDKYPDDQMAGVLAEIEERQVLTMSVSVDVASFIRAETIAAQSAVVVAGFGIHPEEAPAYVDRIDDLTDLVDRSPFVGEIGLDHRFVTDADLYEPQRIVFTELVDLAVRQRKLVNVHCVGAERDTLDVLTHRGVTRGIIHWYSGPLDVAMDMLDAGLFLTIGEEVRHSAHIRALAEAIPDDRLLTETDCPGGRAWLAGEPGRPAHVLDVVEAIAAVRGRAPSEIVEMVRANLALLAGDDPHLVQWAGQGG